MIEYELRIKLDGRIHRHHDERYVCAFLTGIHGECCVAEDESYLYYEKEEHYFELRKEVAECCMEPCKQIGKNEMVILLTNPLTDEEKEILKRRMIEHNEVYELKIIEMKERKKTITIEESSI